MLNTYIPSQMCVSLLKHRDNTKKALVSSARPTFMESSGTKRPQHFTVFMDEYERVPSSKANSSVTSVAFKIEERMPSHRSFHLVGSCLNRLELTLTMQSNRKVKASTGRMPCSWIQPKCPPSGVYSRPWHSWRLRWEDLA